MALHVVADHTIISCNQLILFLGSERLLLSLCGKVGWVGVFAQSFSCPTQLQCCVVVGVVDNIITHLETYKSM